MICLKTWPVWTVPLTLVMILTACGGNHESIPQPGAGTGAVSDELTDHSSLPGLEALPEATHTLSTLGPGWYDVPLDEKLAAFGEVTPHADDELPLAATTGVAFAVLGVHDFDGDSAPTSARFLVSAITGEYYVGVSNYEHGNWDFHGPFTAMATVELPHAGEYYDPTAYTSPGGSCYLTVVLEPGSSLTLSRVELGVDGGDNAPDAPIMLGYSGGPDGTQLFWQYNDDCYRPDFAGFQVERAPAFDDTFTMLTDEPIFNPCYTDLTTTVNVMYWYRLSALDCSGNIAYGSVFSVVPSAMGIISPVAILDYPRGPLYGPVEVTFDLSNSFDPGGAPIINYEIYFGGSDGHSLSSTDPVFTVTLEPGCYMFSGKVDTATSYGFDAGRLKVYPQWQETPVTVRQSTPSIRRMSWLVTARHPATGELFHAFNDLNTGQQLFCYEDGAGGLDVKRYFYANDGVILNRPCSYGTSLVVPLQLEYTYCQIRDNGDNLVPLDTCMRGVENRGGFIGDGAGRFWTAYDYHDGVNDNLQVEQMANASPAVIVVPSTGALNRIDMAYSTSADALDITYVVDATNAMYWVRYPLGGVPGAPVEVSPGSNVINPLIQENPATGRPAIVFGETGYYMYTELAADLVTWSAPVAIDNSEANWYVQDFIYTENGPVVAFPYLSGTLGVYTYDSGWVRQNVFPDPLGFVTTQSLAAVPGSDDIVLTYANQAFSLVSYLCHADGTSDLRWEQTGIEGLGMELHAAPAADGIHAVMNMPDNSVLHLQSPDGATWNELTGVPDGTRIGLASNSDGVLFLSYSDSVDAHLDWWDGAAWNSRYAFPTNQEYRFFLQRDLMNNGVAFCGYSSSAGNMIYRVADEFTEFVTIDDPISQFVWNGLIGYKSSRTLLLLSGTTNPEFGQISRLVWSGTSFTQLDSAYATYIGDQNPYLIGRTMGTGHFYPSYYSGRECAYWTGMGTTENTARRFEHNQNIIDFEDIPIADDVVSPRRTVSVAEAGFGSTAVALLADLDDDHAVMEWSSYGSWEQLPVPDLTRMQAPELVVDMDGRWHIIYRDWLTDDLRCLSTL